MAYILGTARPDALRGTAFGDTINGLAGFDTLAGGNGDDIYVLDDITEDDLFGFDYDEVVEQIGEGRDTVLVTAIDNPATAFGIERYLLPDNVEDGLIGGTLAFELQGNYLDNLLIGNNAANTLLGGGGNDTLAGGAGRDELIGGPGNDVYRLSDLSQIGIDHFVYDQIFETGVGTDKVIVLALDHPDPSPAPYGYTLPFGVENGVIIGTLAFDLSGNELPNSLEGNAATNELEGYAAADTLNGGLGFDTLIGGAGNDIYLLTDRVDFGIFFGSFYDNVIERPDAGIDTVFVTARDDPYTLFANGYVLEANVENGRIVGPLAFDLVGNSLPNNLAGNSAANRLTGLGGNDRIAGGSGNDLLFGGTGKDVLTGGRGADRFAFDTALNPATNVDRLADFTAADDTILLDRTIFTRIGPNGTLAAAAFRIGTAAADASDRIVYNPATGNIFYDADGVGGAAQRLFAQVAPGTALGRTDFVVYSLFVATGASDLSSAGANRAMDEALALVAAPGQAENLSMIDLPAI